ncbi:hypothetical protein B0T14DRAFT_566005 [Immersiella caudata]|uniref:Uncharacterized protein n=1 Tax=Immersiella caudata TaxID=314043 RepID=A0AA39WPC1_9PEZI|nr:hypothetical protein B0T14DRAFT_566005 [Immersiella caudata]
MESLQTGYRLDLEFRINQLERHLQTRQDHRETRTISSTRVRKNRARKSVGHLPLGLAFSIERLTSSPPRDRPAAPPPCQTGAHPGHASTNVVWRSKGCGTSTAGTPAGNWNVDFIDGDRDSRGGPSTGRKDPAEGTGGVVDVDDEAGGDGVKVQGWKDPPTNLDGNDEKEETIRDRRGTF